MAVTPRLHLLVEIRGRLAGERRVAGIAFAARAVTGGAGRDAAPGIAPGVGRRHPDRRGRASGDGRQCCIISRDQLAFLAGEGLGDADHPWIAALPVGIIAELAGDIAAVESRQPRRAMAVALALQSVACQARIGRTRRSARQRDHFAVAVEGIANLRPRAGRSGKKGSQQGDARKEDHYGSEPVARTDGSG